MALKDVVSGHGGDGEMDVVIWVDSSNFGNSTIL